MHIKSVADQASFPRMWPQPSNTQDEKGERLDLGERLLFGMFSELKS